MNDTMEPSEKNNALETQQSTTLEDCFLEAVEDALRRGIALSIPENDKSIELQNLGPIIQ